MTWIKKGQEFTDECALAGLSDAAYRTHDEAIGWIYRVEEKNLRVPKHMLRRIATTDDLAAAVEQLVGVGFWEDTGSSWKVIHHGRVIRQSIAQQVKHRGDERDRQRRKRADVGTNVGTNVEPNVGETQSVSQPVTNVPKARGNRGQSRSSEPALSRGTSPSPEPPASSRKRADHDTAADRATLNGGAKP